MICFHKKTKVQVTNNKLGDLFNSIITKWNDICFCYLTVESLNPIIIVCSWENNNFLNDF